MNHVKRKLAVILAAGLLILTFAPVTSAAYWSLHESGCGGYMVNNSACWKENANGGGDILLLIQGSPTYIDNLGQLSVPAGTTCSGGIFNNGTWNDCLSWVTWNIGSGYELCGWKDAWETGQLLFRIPGPNVGSNNLTTSQNDNISSISVEPIAGGRC